MLNDKAIAIEANRAAKKMKLEGLAKPINPESAYRGAGNRAAKATTTAKRSQMSE